MYSICLSINAALVLSSALERDGRKGSLAKFGRSVGIVCFANVPCSEAMVVCLAEFIINHVKLK